MRWWVLVAVVGCSRVQDPVFEPWVIPDGAGGGGTVTFRTRVDGQAFVRFGKKPVGDAEVVLDRESPWRPAEHGVVELRGLVLGQTYVGELVVADGDREITEPLGEFSAAPPPLGVPVLTRGVWAPERSCLDGGYVLFNHLGNKKSGVVIVDREGEYVWAVASPSPEQVGRARPSRDGSSILWNVAHEFKAADIAAIVRQPLDGSAPPTVTHTPMGHHDFVELPDGDLAWLAYDIRRAPHPDGSGDVCVAAEALYEGPEGMTEGDPPTTVWNTWDPEDYPPGIYELTPDAGHYGTGPTDPERRGFLEKFPCDDPPDTFPLEFQHANSLAYVEDEDAYYSYWRWLDTMVRVDRATGALTWEWGGPFSSLDGATHEHAHFSDVWAGGVLMMDNRDRQSLSRLVEYTWDGDSYVESWTSPLDHFEELLGDVRRMPIDGCDNLLVSLSDDHRIVEMTRDGEIVWELGVAGVPGRVWFLPSLYDLSARFGDDWQE